MIPEYTLIRVSKTNGYRWWIFFLSSSFYLFFGGGFLPQQKDNNNRWRMEGRCVAVNQMSSDGFLYCYKLVQVLRLTYVYYVLLSKNTYIYIISIFFDGWKVLYSADSKSKVRSEVLLKVKFWKNKRKHYFIFKYFRFKLLLLFALSVLPSAFLKQFVANSEE